MIGRQTVCPQTHVGEAFRTAIGVLFLFRVKLEWNGRTRFVPALLCFDRDNWSVTIGGDLNRRDAPFEIPTEICKTHSGGTLR
jgi:hypothetical protein